LKNNITHPAANEFSVTDRQTDTHTPADPHRRVCKTSISSRVPSIHPSGSSQCSQLPTDPSYIWGSPRGGEGKKRER